MKNAQELEEVLKSLEPGKSVTIIYKVQDREVVMEVSAKKGK